MRTAPLLLGLLMVGVPACKATVPPGAGAATSATAMGDWRSWQDLSPLVEVARTHADKATVAALDRASDLLREGKAKTADAQLAGHASGSGRHWVSVARADLAVLHFTVCIRGVALRLEDTQPAALTARNMDYSEETRIEPGDVSIEAMLTNLDVAVASEIEALATQALIARARLTAFASRCAANEEVARIAQGVMESDLATLAAQGHLTPDLAFMWAGVQMGRFSSAAARPFLLQAIEGGFDDPSAVYMLAVIALEQREYDQADELAVQAIEAYEALGDDTQRAQGHFIRGEVARARGQAKQARTHYDAALAIVPSHIAALLAVAGLVHGASGEDDARDYLHGALPHLVLEGPLDEASSARVSQQLETLVVLAEDPHVAQLCRDALLHDIDAEKDAMRRGLRYFYAATIDTRLGEYELAHGHGVLAKEEFAEAGLPPPIDIEAFLRRLQGSR